MPTALAPAPIDRVNPRIVPDERLHRFSVAQYHQLIEGGILGPNERVELLEGWIVEKMTRKPIHDATIQQIIDGAMKRLPNDWSCRPQCAITTLESEPEPDFAIVRGSAKDYRHRHPGPADVGLVIEVADSSLALDRDWKIRIYGRAGIRNYWIVNLIEWTVEVFTDPTGDADNPTYRTTSTVRRGQSIALSLADLRIEIPVNELLLDD